MDSKTTLQKIQDDVKASYRSVEKLKQETEVVEAVNGIVLLEERVRDCHL